MFSREPRQVRRVVRLKQSIASVTRDLRAQSKRLKRAARVCIEPAVPVCNKRPADQRRILRFAVGVAEVFRGLQSLVVGPNHRQRHRHMYPRQDMRPALPEIMLRHCVIQRSGSPADHVDKT